MIASGTNVTPAHRQPSAATTKSTELPISTGNPIPGLDAFLKQASGHSPSCGAQLAPGQRAIQVLDSGPIRGSIGVVQHRTEHAALRHAFSQVLHGRYSRSHIVWNSRWGDQRLMEGTDRAGRCDLGCQASAAAG